MMHEVSPPLMKSTSLSFAALWIVSECRSAFVAWVFWACKTIFFYKLGQQINQLHVYVCILYMHMCSYVCVWLWVYSICCSKSSMVGQHTYTLCGFMYVDVRRREKYRAGPCFSRALLPEQPPESCWWLRYMWRVVWWESWQDGGERNTGVEALKKWEISLFGWVDVLQGTSVYSGGIHGAPLRLRLLLQVVL